MHAIDPRAVMRAGKRRGLQMTRQHFLILQALATTPGYVSFEMLGRALGTVSRKPETVLATRIAVLRKAVTPFGFSIENRRGLGYGLFETELPAVAYAVTELRAA